MRTLEQLNFDNTYASLPEIFFSEHQPQALAGDFLIHFNPQVAQLLGMDAAEGRRGDLLDIFAGRKPFAGFRPIAACYAGHQFGQYVSRLGDGRAILLGQLRTAQHQPWDLQLKGAGQTLYSRGSDGRAVLRSSIREYLCSAAMQGLGIPTTHALFLSGSREEVYREQIEPGAMVLRVAPSHIRFGSFEYFFYAGHYDELQQLTDYVLHHYYPHLLSAQNPVLAFLEEVIVATAGLIAQWQAVGFAHGVMNTDNMSIHGITLDYGPFGFVEQYEPGYICNHSDPHGRYAFDKQPEIGLFNLSCLAQALLPVLHGEVDEAVALAKAALAKYQDQFVGHYAELMRRKLGFSQSRADDQQLVSALLDLLATNRVDYTIFFRQLSEVEPGGCRDLFVDRVGYDRWFAVYQQRLGQEAVPAEARSAQMKRVNPRYILRNYLAEMAIRKAQHEDDYSVIEQLMQILQDPFAEHEAFARYAGHPPAWAQQIEVSCSS
ncbi:MAG: YdiU family protein [Gammaproteobacteria bacterium]|nr:YdiU family protein [Gammaproteobacteria bacterium]